MSGDSTAFLVPAGEDRLGERHGLGVSTIDFKVIAPGGGLLALENTFHAKGGPSRHLHLEQDEWFYVLESEFIIEVGDDRHALRPGIQCWGRAACRTCGRTSATGAGVS